MKTTQVLLWDLRLFLYTNHTNYMRHTIISIGTFITFLIAGGATAQLQQKLKIEEAVVFLNGAELTSRAKLNLTPGENEILFTNVAGDINAQSITVGASGGVVVESATFMNNFLGNEIITAQVKEIKDSIGFLSQAKKPVNDQLIVVNEQISLLASNKKVSGETNGLSVGELTKLLDLYSARYEGYLNQKSRLEEVLRKTDERINKLNQQLNEEQRKGVQPGGQILVKFYAKEATPSVVAIDYVVPNAGWSPTYDIMADAVNMPIKLAYKANIHQNCGVNWENVRLSLSTGNPNEGVTAPVLNPVYLAFYRPPVVNNYQNQGHTLERSEIAAMPTTQVTDMVSTTPGVYQYQRGNDVSIAGGRTSGTIYIIDGVQVQGTAGVQSQENTSIEHYVTVDNAGVNSTFDIDLPYTIPCDGKEHLVAVKKYEVPATYRYYAAPKLDKDAFLQAQVTNWEDLNLMTGPTNIFYEGTYVGQGTLDPHRVKDTLNISLGRDKKIVVKRERDTKLRSVKSIGSNVRESFAYTIMVRNNRKESINLTIQDQLPVSNDKSIVLEDTDDGGAETENNTGFIKWNLVVAPNELKNLEFGFTVKYPKGKIVANLR